ncbi:MAG: ROK family protein [Planctomycetota bacterium]
MPKNDEPLYLGIDLGGTNMQCGVCRGHEVLARDGAKTKAEEGRDDVLSRMVELIDRVCEEAGVKRGDVSGLGIGAPGAIDVHKGVMLKGGNIGWSDFPLRDALSELTGMPVTVDNDVNVAAWGEQQAGAGRGHDDLIAIWVGTGIGGGLVLNGSLYHGSRSTAGEIGFTVLNADGVLGRRYFEHLASRTSVVHHLQRMLMANHESVVPELVDGKLSKVRSKVLGKAVAAEDPLTREVISIAARYVGVGAANAVTLLSLPCVVLGGGLTEAVGDFFVDAVRESFKANVFPHHLQSCKIVASELEDDAGVIGAALLARERLSGG